MQDVFYEETAVCENISSEKRKYVILNVLKIFSIIFLVLWVMIIFLTYNFADISTGSLLLNILYLLFPIAFFVGSAFLFNKMRNKHCVDYDYVFISGSIRLSKVINNIKRKNLYNFETSHIEKIGKYGSNSFNSYQNQPNVKTVILTSNGTPAENKSFYYMAVNGVEQNKQLIVLECTDLFIRNVMKFTNSYVLEKDFK